MKTAKVFLALYLSVALLLMGCGPDFMIKRDINPVITKGQPMITRSEPMVTREKTRDTNVIFVFPKPDDPKLIKRLGLTKAYTVFAAQERMKKEGGEWRGFINMERVVLRNYGVKNGVRSLYGPGYLEPGHVFFAKFIREDKDGNRLWQARFIGQCGNEIPADDLMILETPVVYTERLVTTKHELVTNEVVYRDIDYKPALWMGLGGVLLGLGLGYLFWHGATQVVAAAGAPLKPPGAPAF